MTDPVARAARRQNTIDRLAEHLTDWGCPPDLAPSRAAGLLHTVEAHGWAMPAIPVPPMRGPGSTPTGRAAARALWQATRRRHQECPASPPAGVQEPLTAPPGYTDTPEPPRGAQGATA